MAKKFEFASVTDTLDIAGHIYRIDCNSDKTLTALDTFSGNCIALAKQADNCDKNKFIDKSIAEMAHMLDSVLGEGACDEIFAIRGKNYHDMFEVCMYVCESISEARDRHADKKTEEMQKRNYNKKGKTTETAKNVKITQVAEDAAKNEKIIKIAKNLSADDIRKLTDTVAGLMPLLTAAEQ